MLTRTPERLRARLACLLVGACGLASCATAPPMTWERIAGTASAVELERDVAICEGAAVNAAARVPPAQIDAAPRDIEFTATSATGQRYQGTATTSGSSGGFARGFAVGTQARLTKEARAATMKACMAERGWLQRPATRPE